MALKNGWKSLIMNQYKVLVEKHTDGYVAYPLGLKGIVVAQGDTYESVLSDVKSAIAFHVETFGQGSSRIDSFRPETVSY